MRKQQKKVKLNKKQAAVVSGLVFAIGLLICGLSIAFFSNRDVVTNQQKAKRNHNPTDGTRMERNRRSKGGKAGAGHGD